MTECNPRNVIAAALCCKGEACRAPHACPAAIPAHWSQQQAVAALVALTASGFRVAKP